jgi:hypothetical protein
MRLLQPDKLGFANKKMFEYTKTELKKLKTRIDDLRRFL